MAENHKIGLGSERNFSKGLPSQREQHEYQCSIVQQHISAAVGCHSWIYRPQLDTCIEDSAGAWGTWT